MIFETIRRLYNDGSLSETGLESAAMRGFITWEQYRILTEKEPSNEQSA